MAIGRKTDQYGINIIMKRTLNVYNYHVRKCKKAENSIRREKFLGACLNGNGEVFAEIKKLRKSNPVIASSMDGVQENVEEHFVLSLD